ncbi:uncharacterized protein TrAFT101_000523 [Trichoderma asperellum]|uniref:CFEM domain-containing protein n=1 Tax=Trichoderma asperellum (strain ATCC 204424 / CBS 433.97 / NBRC 101777) TaxID=1042311 RepID=A0A2T3ZJV0_TRIA4|nr:hypothetical protein M441DRAFT_43164 [Trichoderma asperellum CBS 433.97]PTB45052.1 hypothetical protein M441DRAFT_43164 [Trichoderma asperellum CBS 433.97]UKZ84620.1 hypothetical protein TrAFT101_000523 [Trichoderma asperellum]
MLRRSSLVVIAAVVTAAAATTLSFRSDQEPGNGTELSLVEQPVNTEAEPSDWIALPLCALNCVTIACSKLDISCICKNVEQPSHTLSCLKSSCSFSDSLLTMSLAKDSCGSPVRDRSGRFKVMNYSLGFTTLTIAVIRFASKFLFSIRQGFGPDDWALFAAAFIGIPCIAFNVWGLIDNGLGKDIWTLAPSTISKLAQWFVAMEVFYVVIMTVIKTSLMLFYLDLFTGTQFRKLIWGTVILLAASCVSFVIGTLVQCVPLEFTWEQFDGSDSAQGQCINVNAFGWANAAVNIAIDFWLLAIPLIQLYKLDTHWKRKLSAASMFLTAVIATIISIVRLQSLFHFGNSANPTWDHWNVAYWSTVEVNVSIICTCLPSIRLILAHLFPRVIGSSLVLPPVSEDSWIGEKITSPNPLDVESHELCNSRSIDGTSKTSVSVQHIGGIFQD